MPNHLHYRDGVLHCESVALPELLARCGSPLYVYTQAALRENVQALRRAFAASQLRLCYAVKANGNLALLRLLREWGLGFDVVSGGELYLALRAGADPAEIVFAGVGKTDAELAYALEQQIGWFNVESRDELHALNRLAGQMGLRARAALRLNPDITPDTHHHIVTGSASSKFGISPQQAGALLAELPHLPNIDLRGVHIHVGSLLPDPQPLRAACHAALAFREVCAQAGITLTHLDLGGGFPVDYHALDPTPNWDAFGAALADSIPPDVTLTLEPGRAVVATAGILLTTVQASKQTGSARTIVVDAGMQTLIRPALYDAHHPLLPLHQAAPLDMPTHLAGPICESADYLARDRRLPALQRGDALAVLHTGAYGYSMASNYNAHPRPAEILINGSEWQMTRQRESWKDLAGKDTA